MARPAVSEWQTVFGFDDDPTPGDAEMLGRLADSYRSVANDAGDAHPTVSGLQERQVGTGKSMDKLRDKLGDLAKQVHKLHISYDQAAGALHTYVGQLEDHQCKADHALQRGRDAKNRLDQALSAVLAAGATISALDVAAPPPPDDQEARRSARRAMEEAQDEQAAHQRTADDAQADLDAARMLAEDARELRESDAAVAAQALDDARDDAVPGYSLWEKIKDAFLKALGWISAVLGILALLVPGLQGIGLALAIGSFVTAAIPFAFNIADAVKSGDWDPLDLAFSGLGLLFGGAGFLKVASLGGLAQTLKSIPADLKSISVGASTFKAFPQAFKNPLNVVTNVLSKMPKGLAFRPPKTIRFPDTAAPPTTSINWAGLKGAYKNFWQGPVWNAAEQTSNMAGIGGFFYAISAACGHSVDIHDSSYLEGAT